jgi:radical SAM protein (TIGR04043 family)
MNRALRLWKPLRDSGPTTDPPLPWPELISELQAFGVRWIDPQGPGLSRAGGAGPSDHKAIRLAEQTVMVPIFTRAVDHSPYTATVHADGASALLHRHGAPVTEVTFPRVPRFYARSTADGVPYWKIARLHADDVLATTILQTCVRYGRRESSCQFCAIGQSLASKSTIAEKTPAQLAEVAAAAVELDGVKHIVMTTGTPHTDDRGAAVLANAARAVKKAVAIPIQGQCEPPADLSWFERMAAAGIDTLGMHLEAVTERVRRAIMPGKAEVPLATYYSAFDRAVRVFGRGQVSTYILAGLGDSADEIVDACRDLVALGIYPFVVPFVPIAGTPLEGHPPPSPGLMNDVLSRVAAILAASGMQSAEMKAGCGRCGACSSLRARETIHA